MAAEGESHLDVVLLGAHVQERLKKARRRLEEIRAWADEATPDQHQDPDNMRKMLIEVENIETLLNDLLRNTE